MHFRLPKPLHGWREFVGEVGIIVLGVLIALGAQQIAESIHQRSEVRQTRKALDAELAHNLAAFDGRLAVQSCAERRLDELQSILNRETQSPVALRHDFEPPFSINLQFAVWDAASGEARSLIPLEPKLQYAQLYDIFRRYDQFRDEESNDWFELADLDFGTRLSAQDVKQAKLTIKRLRRLDNFLPAYSSFLQRSAKPLGIHPEPAIDAPAQKLMNRNRATFCSPMI
jgi:hypothetical protein